MPEKKVVTRFPPSPTGFLHIGGVRTALFNYLFAKKNKGSILLRLEDTDTERSKVEFEQSITSGLRWLDLKFDNDSPWKQSERLDIYRNYLKKLVEQGFAYVSKEEAREVGDRAEVIRFKNPNSRITFQDLIRGEISFDTTDLGDFVIAKSLNEPLYHLAVVVDDEEMGVTHVIRGEDHISNTPRQILIQNALKFSQPLYGHIPLILASDRSKMSKRHGAVSVESYRDQGYLPAAMINFLALLGWNPGTPQEIFSIEELIEHFDLSKVQKGGAVFNIEKLNWFNKQYIQKLSSEQKVESARNFVSAEHYKILAQKPELMELMMERVSTFGELRDLVTQGEYNYFFGKPQFEKKSLLWKGAGDLAKAKERLSESIKLLLSVSEDSFNKLTVKEALWPYAEQEGRGEVLWPIRMSLSGKEKSPDPFVLAEMLGKKETLLRLTSAINLL